MSIELSFAEARVIGCLIEKEITTPDYYPLTLNSLTSACNQKSNRDPVTSYSEAEILDIVEGLVAKRLVSDESSFSSRVSKYQHRFCNTEFGDLKLNEQELGIICCLLVRGAQTPGELRTRTNRLCQFTDVKETETVLDKLVARELVVKLEREPGKRESRYCQLFTGLPDNSTVSTSSLVGSTQGENSDYEERIASLESEVAELREQLNTLTSRLDELC
ncbi:DUF480 domain-containing protein [Vibrio sp.]|uniref:DUF480 domain-containing protein n=1 Tax=Vibrio viridaestus TaxID=2487322 RepID=A0A3N9U988_9VIBR|nr:DUF480 domain-containing protein [Vibrio viridaestus]MDC0609453.1 DUF480 domain-containing protein [Vibrio sp.]RQW64786.1 DUF480 domain-containing protein [Vibrio viridaestus]